MKSTLIPRRPRARLLLSGAVETALVENFVLAMLAILNPLGKIPVWIEACEGCDDAVRRRLALLVTATALVLLLIFLFFGVRLLDFLGIDLPAFRVGGGVVILLLGLEMMRGKAVDIDSDGDGEDGEDAFDRAKIRFRQIVIPMAVPILAGPGSITTAILFGSQTEDWTTRLTLGAMLTALMGVVFVLLLMGRRLHETLGQLVLMVQTRIWGLLLTAIAAQLILVGLGESFPAWLTDSLPTQGVSPLLDDVTGDGG